MRQCRDIKAQIRKVDQSLVQTVGRMDAYKHCSDRLTVLSKPVITGPTSIFTDDSVLYSALATSSNTTLGYFISYTFDWGDGSPAQTKAIASGYAAYHVYETSGIYQITVTAQDSLGHKTRETLQVKVSE
jgi:hypothetical protein